MADNFDALSAAVDLVVQEIQAVVGLIGSGQNNNDQLVIESLTGRLTAAANALSAAMPAPAPAPAPVEAPAASTEAPATDAPATDAA